MGTPTKDFLIEGLNTKSDFQDFQEVAKLHCENIHHGIIPLFGQRFVSHLYKHLSEAHSSKLWVVKHNGGVVAFLSGSSSSSKTFSDVITNHRLLFKFICNLAFLNFNILKKVPGVLKYILGSGSNEAIQDSVKMPELLSISVNPKFQGKSLGRMLINEFEKDLLQTTTQNSYIVSTNIADLNSNNFYLKCGFTPFFTRKHHSLTLQTYIKKLNKENDYK